LCVASVGGGDCEDASFFSLRKIEDVSIKNSHARPIRMMMPKGMMENARPIRPMATDTPAQFIWHPSEQCAIGATSLEPDSAD
jgi:hypothetical protein